MKRNVRISLLLMALLLLVGILLSGCSGEAPSSQPEQRKQSPAEQKTRQGKDG